MSNTTNQFVQKAKGPLYPGIVQCHGPIGLDSIVTTNGCSIVCTVDFTQSPHLHLHVHHGNTINRKKEMKELKMIAMPRSPDFIWSSKVR